MAPLYNTRFFGQLCFTQTRNLVMAVCDLQRYRHKITTLYILFTVNAIQKNKQRPQYTEYEMF